MALKWQVWCSTENAMCTAAAEWWSGRLYMKQSSTVSSSNTDKVHRCPLCLSVMCCAPMLADFVVQLDPACAWRTLQGGRPSNRLQTTSSRGQCSLSILSSPFDRSIASKPQCLPPACSLSQASSLPDWLVSQVSLFKCFALIFFIYDKKWFYLVSSWYSLTLPSLKLDFPNDVCSHFIVIYHVLASSWLFRFQSDHTRLFLSSTSRRTTLVWNGSIEKL